MMNTDDNTGQGGSSNPFSDFINDHFFMQTKDIIVNILR